VQPMCTGDAFCPGHVGHSGGSPGPRDSAIRLRWHQQIDYGYWDSVTMTETGNKVGG
jgi:hypothetical protein